MHKYIIKIRSTLLVFLTHHLALPILRIIRKPQVFPYSKEYLLQLPKATLGKELITMLEKKQLKLLPYYAKHDIKHILLQYDTTDEGEVCLQMFMLGNRHLSFPVLITVIFGLLTMPEYWKSFKTAYKRGARCIPISGWAWFALLDVPVDTLIKKLSNEEV